MNDIFDMVPQAAALAFRDGMICLITSSSGRRWVIPKGMLEPEKSTHEIALQEAWEEAGLKGVVSESPIGSYEYEKYGVVHHVAVFLMSVTAAHRDFPEAHLRRRAWFDPEDAIQLVEEPGLRKLIRQAQDERLAPVDR